MNLKFRDLQNATSCNVNRREVEDVVALGIDHHRCGVKIRHAWCRDIQRAIGSCRPAAECLELGTDTGTNE